jgi:iron complex outermembrane receptor protein
MLFDELIAGSPRPPCHRFAVVLLALLIGTPAAAQSTAAISGLVSDPTGAAVVGASVEVTSGPVASRSVTTNGEGRYRVEGLPYGDYVVRVTAPGFRTIERRVSVSAAAPAVADFRLTVQGLEENVLVTGESVRAAVEAQRAVTPGGVTIIDGDELFSRHVNNMADMLRFVPGMFAESGYGNEELFFSSRGSNLDAVDYDKNGIKLLQDGLPVTTADGNNHNRIIDPLTARYATVARGANALTYGASTLGGAIDFISPTARNSAPLSVFFDGGSFGALNGRLTVGRAGEKVDGLLTVEGRNFDGYRDHSSQERFGLYGNAGWQPSPTTNVQVFGTYVNNDLRLPGALTRAEVEADPDQASEAALDGNYGKEVKTGRFAAKVSKSLGANASFSAGLSYEGQSLFHPIVNQVFVDFDGPGPAPPVEVFSLLIDTDHRDFGAMMRYDRRMGRHDLLTGLNFGKGSVNGGNYRNLHGQPNGLAEDYNADADSLEAFVMDRWRASDRWTAVFGAQVVSAARDVLVTNALTGAVTNPNDRYNAFNPRVGVIASLNEAGEVYGNVSRLFEAPTTFQMIDDVRGGNTTLEPMSGTVVEAGWRSRPSQSSGIRWNWDVAAYYARISDEILSLDDPNAPGNPLVTNIDHTTHAGLEAFVSSSIAAGARHRVEPRVSFTANQFHFDNDQLWGDNRLPAAPTYATRGEVLYRHAGGFYAGPTFDFIGKRYVDFANAYTVDGYGLMGLRAGFTSSRWELFTEVRNLFDEDYIATVSVLHIAGPNSRVLYPGAPISAYTGVRVGF